MPVAHWSEKASASSVLSRDVRAGGKDGIVVDRVDGQGDGDGGGVCLPVAGPVGELIASVEVRVRRVGEGPVSG